MTWIVGSSNASGDWYAADSSESVEVAASSVVGVQGTAQVRSRAVIAASSTTRPKGSASADSITGEYWRTGSSNAGEDWGVAGFRGVVGPGEITAQSATGVEGNAQAQSKPRVAAVAQAQPKGSAALISWASVVVAEPIDYGVGSIFHPSNWQLSPPVAGNIIYWEPTDGLSIDSHGIPSADVNNRKWSAQYDDGTGPQRFEIAFYPWMATSQIGVQGAAQIQARPRIAAVSTSNVQGSVNVGTALGIQANSQTSVQGTAQIQARPRIAAMSQTGVQGAAQVAVVTPIMVQAQSQTSVQGSANVTVRARIAALSTTGIQARARLRNLNAQGSAGSFGAVTGLSIAVRLSTSAGAGGGAGSSKVLRDSTGDILRDSTGDILRSA